VTASEWYTEGLSAVVGDIDDRQTFERLRAARARLIIANRDDAQNTNMTLTAREVAPEVPIAAIANDDNAVDILELSGATHVLPLKRSLGEQLANRVRSQKTGVQSIGEYGDLIIAELPVRHTSLAGKSVADTELRQKWGVNIIGIWENGPLQPPSPTHQLTNASVAVVMGTEAKLKQLYSEVVSNDSSSGPVIVIGGGTVGEAAIRTLADQDISVNLIDRDPDRCESLQDVCNEVYEGDASNYTVIHEAGISDASAVLLTTNNDATNVYLTSYCRNLNTDLRVVSRITRTRNLDAIYRAGADFVLSYASLGVDALMSILHNKELLVLGEEADLFSRAVPESLQGHTLRQTEIGAATGLTVVALKLGDETITDLSADLALEPEMELLLIGSDDQLAKFIERFE
jgi:Trk K+ transport system NAD-binding subunit